MTTTTSTATTTTPYGGNWKELVQATTDGDLAILQYHLDQGVDPNYQHPEFMSTPLLEAIQAGQLESVRLLLRHDADPTQEADWEGWTPLECAMRNRQHAIATELLAVLPDDYERECHTFLLTGTLHRDLVSHILTVGHCVVVAINDDDDAGEAEGVAECLRKETGNSKLWVQPKEKLHDFFAGNHNNKKWRPSSIDVWLHKTASVESNLKAPKLPFHGGNAKVVLVLESSVLMDQQAKLALLLEEKETSDNNKITCSAILEPNTWWDTMTYSYWYQTWCESVLELLEGLATGSNGGGKAYNYNRQSLKLPDRSEFEDLSVHATSAATTSATTVTLSKL